MIDPLDSRQVKRIEAVHRGFLYQHLYAAACLLVANRHDVRSIKIEFDEDIELELNEGDRVYIQVKTRSSSLIYSDIVGTLDRFNQLRLEHQEGRRSGKAYLAIVANIAPGPEMQASLVAGDLPEDISLLTPEATTAPAPYLPPAWSSVVDAFNWCSEQARALPMGTLEPETLVWKLAGRVLLAAAGQAPGHVFNTSDLPTLFEQLIIQLQQFPFPPEVYRPLEDEPALDEEARVRIVCGHSGAGKTTWAAQAAQHLGSECAYYDVGDVPGPAIATSLVRELAAQWAAPSADGLRQVLLPGFSGIESLRALDMFLGMNDLKALVVLDNAHRVPANDLRMLIEATKHLRIVLLAQPSQSISELETFIGLQQEVLRGWGLDQTAAEVFEQGARASAAELGRLLALTGGLPLYVRTAAQLSSTQYGGDVGAMCTAIESHTNMVKTAQESILNHSFDALPEQVRDCAAVLSLSDTPLSEEEAAKLVKASFGLDAPALAIALRRLTPLGIVRIYGSRRLQIHDAFRVLGLRRYTEITPSQAKAGRYALKELILESFEKDRDTSRFPLFIRTLVELGEIKLLVDIATEEWFHELGVNSGIWDALDAAAANDKIAPDQRFYALDGLVFAEIKSGKASKVDGQLRNMEALVAKHGLSNHEELVVLLKRMLYEAACGNESATMQAMERAMKIAPDRPDYKRILLYNIAHAMFELGHYAQAEGITRQLVGEYFDLLGLTPQDILGASNIEIAELLKPSPTQHDDIKHIADSLDLLARTTNAQELDSGFARIHAAKFYALANALDSFARVNQDLVDEFIGRGDYIGARQVIEEHLLPVILEEKMLGWIVPVRSQYAVVLGYCGEHNAADAEMDRLAPYLPGLTEDQRTEINGQRELLAQLRQNGIRPGVPDESVKRALSRVKVDRNEACPCGSGRKYKHCHGQS